MHLIFFTIVYAMLITNVTLIDYPKETEQADIRVKINITIAVIILVSMISFELR